MTTFQKIILLPKIIVLLTRSKWLINNKTLEEIIKWISLNLQSTAFTANKEHLEYAVDLSQLINKISLYVPIKSNCYNKALTMKKVLNKKRIPIALHFGVKIEGQNVLKGHAWTEYFNVPIIGGVLKSEYKSVQSFI